MNEQESMLYLGNASEETLKGDAFNTVVNDLIESTFSAFVNSDPGENEKRTVAYYQYRALREVVDTLKQNVSVRDEINQRNKAEEEQTMSLDNVNESSNPGAAETIDDAAEAILGMWEDAEELSEENQEAEVEAADETEAADTEEDENEEDLESDEDDEDPDEDAEEDDEEASDEDEDDSEEVQVIDEESLVEIVIDGETKQASVKDLKRLYGQEASLTRKSQEMASQRKLADDQMQKADASLQAMLSRAQERYKPYSEVDMLVASKQMTADDFTALRAEARQAEEDLKFLSEEADNFYGYVKQQQGESLKQQATECIKVLQQDVPDWNNDLYNDIRSYAISQGLPEDQVNQYADPNVIKLLNKARMFDQTKKVATVKKAKAAKKILRSKKAPPNNAELKQQNQQRKVDQLRANANDLDNIADVIMSNWQ